MKRRLFIAGTLGAALAGCSSIGTRLNENAGFKRVLESTEPLNRALIGTHGMAREYDASQISPDFPLNSLPTPADASYAQYLRDGFASYRLRVDGDVAHPQALSLAQLARMPQQRQITRHDCVEGWSAIAQWDGVRLADVLTLAQPKSGARFVVFHCMDRDQDGAPYYESLDLHQAAHPQTMLALAQNGRRITPDRGAPVRLRVPTQLGYKSAKWVARIQVVSAMTAMSGGKGGYWEDQGYEWYAGI